MKILLIIVAFLSIATISIAETSLEFVWEYPTISDVKGFKIFQVGTADPIVTVTDGSLRTVTKSITDLSSGKSCYTMLAYDNTQNSGMSPEYCIDPVPVTPGGFKVNIVVTVKVGG